MKYNIPRWVVSEMANLVMSLCHLLDILFGPVGDGHPVLENIFQN